jgi:hypothetical protein
MSKLKRIQSYREFLKDDINYQRLKGTEQNGLFFYPLEDILNWLREIEVKILTNKEYNFSDKMMLRKFEKVYKVKL